MNFSKPNFKSLVVKPIISKVDLIDMQFQADGEYKCILVYQDHLTKFVHMCEQNKNEVNDVLLEIFAIFGALGIFKGDNDREVAHRDFAVCGMNVMINLDIRSVTAQLNEQTRVLKTSQLLAGTNNASKR